MLAEATVMSFWPSDTVSLAIIGLVTMFVKDWLDRTRVAKADVKVAAVQQALVTQAVASERREDKLDEVTIRVAENTAITEKAADKIAAAFVGEALKVELVESETLTEQSPNKGLT